MTTASRVLAIASKEVGYSRWKDPLAGTKYGRWYADLGKGSYYAANGVPYCAMFASWVFAQAGAKCVGLPEAYCPYIVSAAKNAGKWVPRGNLKPGDLILFSWAGNGIADHVGIVEKVFAGYVQTIEGNTSSASNANGGLVARGTRSLDYTVLGGVRPAWSANTSTSTTSKEIKVKTYTRRDARLPKTVQPDRHFYLHTSKTAKDSNAANVVGGVGPYSLDVMLGLEGQAGEVVGVRAIVQDVKTGKNGHTTRWADTTIPPRGYINARHEFKFSVPAGSAVYVQVKVSAVAKKPVKVTNLETTAYLFVAA